MLRYRNKYCSNCLKSQQFLDLGSYLVCVVCSKILERLSLVVTPLRDADIPGPATSPGKTNPSIAANPGQQQIAIAGLIISRNDDVPENPSAI